MKEQSNDNVSGTMQHTLTDNSITKTKKSNRKTKEQPVTRKELQDCMKYIDVSLSGRLRTMENKLGEIYSNPSKKQEKQLHIITKIAYASLALLIALVVVILVDVIKAKEHTNSNFDYLNSLRVNR